MLHHVEIYVSDLDRSVKFWSPLLERLGYEPDRWDGGMTFVGREGDPYLTLLQAPPEHAGAGYHRQRVGLNHLAFRGRSRAHVDELAAWVKQAGYPVLYEDKYPFATAPDYYAMYCEDPDRIKIEIVAPPEE